MPVWFTAKLAIPVAAVILTVGLLVITYHAGQNSQKAIDAAATIETLNKRDKINGKVNDYDAERLCTGMGGQWVQSNCQ